MGIRSRNLEEFVYPANTIQLTGSTDLQLWMDGAGIAVFHVPFDCYIGAWILDTNGAASSGTANLTLESGGVAVTNPASFPAATTAAGDTYTLTTNKVGVLTGAAVDLAISSAITGTSVCMVWLKLQRTGPIGAGRII